MVGSLKGLRSVSLDFKRGEDCSWKREKGVLFLELPEEVCLDVN